MGSSFTQQEESLIFHPYLTPYSPVCMITLFRGLILVRDRRHHQIRNLGQNLNMMGLWPSVRQCRGS